MDLKSKRTVTNPTNEDFTHAWDGQDFTIKAGETEEYPSFLAEHLAGHLAKKILIDKGAFVDKLVAGNPRPHTVPITDVDLIKEKLLDQEKRLAKEPEITLDEFGIPHKTKEPELKGPDVPDTIPVSEAKEPTLAELRALAKKKGIKGSNLMKKETLLAKLNE